MKESKRHFDLKNKAKEILKGLGFKEDEIIFEYLLPINKKQFFRIDVAGIKKDRIVAIECGMVQRKDKLEILKEMVDEVIHLPYEKEEGIINPITIELDKKLWDDFKEIIPRTTTLNEAIVSLIANKVIEEKKK